MNVNGYSLNVVMKVDASDEVANTFSNSIKEELFSKYVHFLPLMVAVRKFNTANNEYFTISGLMLGTAVNQGSNLGLFNTCIKVDQNKSIDENLLDALNDFLSKKHVIMPLFKLTEHLNVIPAIEHTLAFALNNAAKNIFTFYNNIFKDLKLNQRGKDVIYAIKDKSYSDLITIIKFLEKHEWQYQFNNLIQDLINSLIDDVTNNYTINNNEIDLTKISSFNSLINLYINQKTNILSTGDKMVIVIKILDYIRKNEKNKVVYIPEGSDFIVKLESIN